MNDLSPKGVRTNVSTANGLRGRLEAKANILVPPLLLGRDLLANCTQTRNTPRTQRISTSG